VKIDKPDYLQAPSDYESGFWRNVANNYRYTYAPILSQIKQSIVGENDPNFVVTDEMLKGQPAELMDELLTAGSQQEFDYQVNLYKRMTRIKESLYDYGGIGSMLFAGVFDPVNLIPLPTAKGVGFIRGAKRVGLGAATVTAGIETIRAQADPTYKLQESAFAIGGSALFGGLIGGAVGGITASRVGKDFANASAYDDGLKANVKEVKVKGMRKKVFEAEINPNTDKALREEGIVPISEDARLNEKQFDSKLKKTAFGFEATTRLTAFGRMLHRFDSNAMGRWVTSIFSDLGTMQRGIDKGDVAPQTVNLLRGQWQALSYDYIAKTRNLWLESKDIVKPRTVGTQNITFTIENLKSKFNKSKSYNEFMREVVLADIRASYKGDTVLLNESPAVQKAVQETRKLYKRARDEGIDAKLFNTADNLNFKMDKMAEFAGRRIRNINVMKRRLAKSSRKNTIQMQIRNEEEFLDKTLREMNSLESFAFSLIRAEGRIFDSVDNILSQQLRKESQRESYKDIMESMARQRRSRKSYLEKLAKQIKKTHYENHVRYLEIFLELQKKFSTRGLSDKELIYMENLGKRIEAPQYSPKQKKIIEDLKNLKRDPQSGLTDRQKRLFAKAKKELKIPINISDDSVSEILGLLRQGIINLQKDFKGPKGERSYTMRKYMVDTIIDERENFHSKVIVPYILKNPSGRLATLIDAQTAGEKIALFPEEILNMTVFKEPMPKVFFTRISTANIDRIEDILKQTNLKNIFMLEDGRFYKYDEVKFGKLEQRFADRGTDFRTTPFVLRNAIRKQQVTMSDGKTKLMTVVRIEPNGLGNHINRSQMKQLLAQIDYVKKKYKGKIPDEDFEKLISFKRIKPLTESDPKSKVKKGSFEDLNVTASQIIKNAGRNLQSAELEAQGMLYKVVSKSENEAIDEGLVKPTKVEVTDEMIQRQADLQATQLINRIIGESDAQDYDGIAGRGSQKFVMHRNFDMPNYLLTKESNGIADFIDLDGEGIMRTYMNKFGPAVEMSRMFDGDRFGDMKLYEAIDDVLVRHSDEIENNPNKMIEDLADQRNDIDGLLDPILNRAPIGMEAGTATNRLVKAGMQLGQLAMMGMTTIASLADFGKIILSRGISQAFGRYLKAWFRDLNELNLRDESVKHMLKFIGEGQETLSGAGASRVAEQSTGLGEVNNRVLGKVGDKVFEALDKMVGGFYNANLLNHWTAINKRLVMPMSADRIIRTGAMLNKKYTGNPGLKKYFQTDLKILKSFGLSETDLKQIHKLHNPKKRGKDIYYSNADEWMETNPQLFRKYVNAIRADVLSTIITPTEADKPLMSYGLFKASRWNRKMQDRQHNIFKIPFQFMSWAFASNNKIVISTLQGRHQGVGSGIMAMFALGMLSDFARNPDWWRYKSTEERIMKAVEYSGLTSYILDINSFAEIASNNYIGIRPNLFGQDNPFTGTAPDQISEIGGPVGSMIADVYKMLFSDNVDFNDRVNMTKRLIPYNNLFYTKWLFDGIRDSITDDRITLNY